MKAKKLLKKHAATGDLEGITESDLEGTEQEISGIVVASMEAEPEDAMVDMPEKEQQQEAPRGLMARGM